jgi:tetratricopeptide (TPR) repeat protein
MEPSQSCFGTIRLLNILKQCSTGAVLLAGMACALWPPVLALAQAAPASIATAIGALREGKNDEAILTCNELLRADPRSSKVWTLKALALQQSGQAKEALTAYEHALTFSPEYLPALEGAAQLNYAAQSAKAIPLLRKIISIQPADATAHAMLGVLEFKNFDYTTAESDFAAAELTLGSQPAALMDYAISLVHLKRIPEAIARFEQLLVLRPSDVAARYDLALIQWRADKPADALTTLQPLLDDDASDTHILRLAAAIRESNNETPQAVELLRTAMMKNPLEVENYVDFATLSFTHGSYSVGIDIVNLGLTKLPNSAALYMARGVLFGQNGDFEKAMSDFEYAHKLDPNYAMVRAAEGIAQSQLHNHDAALANFRRQVREHPKDAYGHYLLAEALSWSPPDAKPGNNETGIENAIAAAKKAIELEPQLVNAHDLLASLYLQIDKPELAEKACRAALAINPKDQQAIYSLILALRKTGIKQQLNTLVKQLTELRKSEGEENARKVRYGQLVEAR